MRTASVITGCCGTDIAMPHHRCHLGLPNNFDSAGYSVYMTVGRETYCYGAFGSKRLLSPQDCVLGDLFPLTPRHSVFAGQMHSLSPSQLIVGLGRLWSRPMQSKKINFIARLVQNRVKTNGRTDMTDFITLPTKAAGN